MDLRQELKDATEWFARAAASIRALPDVELVALAMRAQSPTAALREEIASRAPSRAPKAANADGEVAKSAARPPEPAKGGSLGNRIVSALREQPRTQEGLATLLRSKQTVVSATLTKLRVAGKVVRPESIGGKWKAA